MIQIPTLDEYQINEDFFNPFNIERKKNDKPKHISDYGENLQLRKETFNLARVEFSKRPSGEFTIQAKTQFAKGEIVEICPVIIMGEEAKTINGLKDIMFEIDKDKNEWGLVLGYGSLYKHSDEANIDYAYNGLTKQMYFITKKTINLSDELTINYGKDYWMERMNYNTMLDVKDPSVADEKNESEVQPNSADIENKTNAKTLSSPKNVANPVISGIPILGGGQS
jgi:uncharacterized protein